MCSNGEDIVSLRDVVLDEIVGNKSIVMNDVYLKFNFVCNLFNCRVVVWVDLFLFWLNLGL